MNTNTNTLHPTIGASYNQFSPARVVLVDTLNTWCVRLTVPLATLTNPQSHLCSENHIPSAAKCLQ
jgi:hypothetical protein